MSATAARAASSVRMRASSPARTACTMFSIASRARGSTPAGPAAKGPWPTRAPPRHSSGLLALLSCHPQRIAVVTGHATSAKRPDGPRYDPALPADAFEGPDNSLYGGQAACPYPSASGEKSPGSVLFSRQDTISRIVRARQNMPRHRQAAPDRNRDRTCLPVSRARRAVRAHDGLCPQLSRHPPDPALRAWGVTRGPCRSPPGASLANCALSAAADPPVLSPRRTHP